MRYKCLNQHKIVARNVYDCSTRGGVGEKPFMYNVLDTKGEGMGGGFPPKGGGCGRGFLEILVLNTGLLCIIKFEWTSTLD